MRILPILVIAGVFAVISPCLARAPEGIAPIASTVAFEPQLNHEVSAKLQFRDETNKPVALGEYFGGQPIVLLFTYYGCSNLCPSVITNLLGRLPADSAGSSIHPAVVVVSVNPDDSASLAAQKKTAYLGGRGIPIDHWHFLIGDRSSIGQLAQEVGLRYVYDEASHQYAHPAGIVVLTPRGNIASYLFGFDFTSAQLSRELSDAAVHRTASGLQRVLLVCFHYSPLTGPHSATVLALLQVLSGASLLAIAIFGLVRIQRKHRNQAPAS